MAPSLHLGSGIPAPCQGLSNRGPCSVSSPIRVVRGLEDHGIPVYLPQEGCPGKVDGRRSRSLRCHVPDRAPAIFGGAEPQLPRSSMMEAPEALIGCESQPSRRRPASLEGGV